LRCTEAAFAFPDALEPVMALAAIKKKKDVQSDDFNTGWRQVKKVASEHQSGSVDLSTIIVIHQGSNYARNGGWYANFSCSKEQVARSASSRVFAYGTLSNNFEQGSDPTQFTPE